MKKLLTVCLLVLLSCTLGRSQITSGEYFWDTDPGIDLASPIPASVFAGVTNDTYSFSPSTAGISQGSHRLYFRFKDAAGELSQTVSQFIYIGENGIASIAEDEVGLLEYYWDDNSSSPTQITLTNPPLNGKYSFNAPSTGLITGLHYLSVRVKDKNGLWSGYNKVPVFIFGNTPLPNIQTIEYYVDTDLGEGLNTSVSFSPTMANDVTSNFEIPTTGLSNGQHVATMRVQDTDGTWSGKFSKAFNLDPQFSLTAEALAGQYYCLGGTIEVPITSTGTWPAENEYRLELSDQTGNNFVPIVTTTDFGGSGDKLIGTIPTGLPIGSGYKIRAVTTLPYIRRESSTSFTIGISATASVNSPICAQETLNFTSTSSTPATYSWTGPSPLMAVQNPSIISALSSDSGTYTVTATNVGGCTATASVVAVVNPNPTPNAGADVAICDGNSTTIGATAVAGNTYAWSPSAGLSNPAISNPIASPNTTATYVVTMTTTATGCSATDNVVVTVNPNPILNTNHQIIDLPTPGFVDLTLPSVTNGSTLPSGTVLSYFTDFGATNPLSNPNNITMDGVYFIKATSLASCVDIKPVNVTSNTDGCPGSFTLVSPTDDSSMGLTTKISSGSINASNVLSGTSNYIIDAKNAVILEPGFSTQGNNVIFLAVIGGCP